MTPTRLLRETAREFELRTGLYDRPRVERCSCGQLEPVDERGEFLRECPRAQEFVARPVRSSLEFRLTAIALEAVAKAMEKR